MMGHIYRELSKAVLKASSDYFSDRLVVEECENIHVHYRNLRLEFSMDEFYVFADKIHRASKILQAGAHRLSIPLDKINPYNETHPKGFETSDKDHREGIELVKQLIKKDKKILPILVRPVKEGLYQRQDGFKRYFAFKELGYENIECFVSPTAKLGGQDGIPWEVTNA